MKILHIGKYYEPELGGIESFTYNLYHELKKNVDIVVLCYNNSKKTEILNDKGIKVVKVGTYGKLRSQPIAFGLKSWIKKLSKDVDIINLHFPNPLMEMALLRASVDKEIVITYHADIIKQKILSKIYNPFMNKIFTQAKYIIATSPDYAKTSQVLKKYSSKVKIIPLGTKFDNKYNSKELIDIKKKHGKYILFVGRLIYYKGIEYLIDAFKDVDAKLLIIGTGPLEKQLRKNSTKNIVFLGKVKDLNPYYAGCEFLVFPSSERTEAFGMVQLEAMNFSKPVICTDLGTGTTYINIKNKTGLVVKPKNSQELNSAIKRLLQNPELTKKLGLNAKERVKSFTIEKIAKQYLEVYYD